MEGCGGVYNSFDKYVEAELLEGGNRYDAEEYGLQVINELVLLLS